jgi:hypothetical protein
MDYAAYGEILKWNQKTCKFRPFKEGQDHLLEYEIKRFMRHCIRGLHFSKNKKIILITQEILNLSFNN